MLEVRRLSYEYPTVGEHPVFALMDVSLAVPAGEVAALIGPNGSGKSTLLRCVVGALRTYTGIVSYNGVAAPTLSRQAAARRRTFLDQVPTASLARTLSVAENLALAATRLPEYRSAFGAQRARRDDIARRHLAEVAPGLDTRLDAAVDQLSGGQQQLVALAAATISRPEVLVLDEPTSSLDLAHRRRFFETLRRFASRYGTAVLLSTHDCELAAEFCSAALLLKDGESHGVLREQELTPGALESFVLDQRTK